MSFSLKGKVAVVTGAIGLLGKQHCLALAEAGATVVAADLDENACQAFAKTLDTPALGVSLDVASRPSAEAALLTIKKTFDTVDILINNAAVNDKFEDPTLAAEHSKFENYPEAMWRRMMDVNVTGTFLCSQVFGTEMAKRGTGSIINVASTYGLVAPDQSLYRMPDGTQAFYKSPCYAASKGAVLSLTRFLAAYWGKAGVRCNALSPGGVENLQDDYFVKNYSERTPLGRMAAPEDYRGAIVFLASDASRYMTGANLVVDGGWTAW
jgi:NAD(P)-dependent dehydrogenase (short-subunit alcohol dehydrogenase family)